MRAKSKPTTSVILTLFTLLTLFACGGSAENGETAVDESINVQPVSGDTAVNEATTDQPASGDTPSVFGVSGEDMPFGEAAQWPDYIPADIPELEGEIGLIMVAPDSHIRIFYENVSQDQVLAYLDLLESRGFSLEYRVLIQEGFPDNSEEKIKRGDFDDVVITKGDYRMTITYGADPTYDIYTSGFQAAAIEATTLQWPPDLPKSVPQIPNCELLTINPADFGGYHLTCKKETEAVEEAYIQLLKDSGFAEKNGTTIQAIVIQTTVYENAEAIVIPSIGFSPMFFSIEVYQKIEPDSPSWPADIAALVPSPEACTLTSVTKTGDGGYMIYCQVDDTDAILTYIQTLESAGFSEQEKFEDANENIISITLEKEGTAVTILGGLPSTLTILIKPINP